MQDVVLMIPCTLLYQVFHKSNERSFCYLYSVVLNTEKPLGAESAPPAPLLYQILKSLACLELNSVKNLTAQKEVRPVKRILNTDAATAKANTSEVKKRSSNFSLQEKLDLADIVCTGKDTTDDGSLYSEVFIVTLRSKTVPNKLKNEIYGKIAKRLCQRFNSLTFDSHVGAILKTLDKVNSLSSIQALSFGENEVGKFCVLGASCVKTLIDHKKSSTANFGR